MNLTQAWINKLTSQLSPVKITENVFDAGSARALSDCLEADAANYVYSASISIADAINGIRSGFISWATVKLYYSVYYACRGILALNSAGIIYIGSTPYIVSAYPGSRVLRKKGQTHKIILNEFSARNASHSLLSQEIDLQSPLDWLMEKREIANYKNTRFWEPEIPDHFKKIVDIGVRKSISAYIIDFDLYAFDPEHAILAYPIKCLKTAYETLDTKGNRWSADDKKYIANLFRDNHGPLTEIYRIFQ